MSSQSSDMLVMICFFPVSDDGDAAVVALEADVHVLDVAGEAGRVAEHLGAVLADERLPGAVVVGEGARRVDVPAPPALLVLAVRVVQPVVVVLL